MSQPMSVAQSALIPTRPFFSPELRVKRFSGKPLVRGPGPPAELWCDYGDEAFGRSREVRHELAYR